MTREVVLIHAHQTMAEALLKAGRIMWAQHVHRLPVVNSQRRVVGMITSSDMVAALVQAADEAESCSR
jgi:CBS domain-containing protein